MYCLSGISLIITPVREIGSQKYANSCRWYVFVLMVEMFLLS